MDTIDRNNIRVYFKCGKEQEYLTFQIRDEAEYWSEDRFKSINYNPRQITIVDIGPKTIVELYSGPNHNNSKWILKNHTSNKIKRVYFGCYGKHDSRPNIHHPWTNRIRSLKLFDHKTYERIFGLTICRNHNECKKNELCVCPSGHEDGRWCPETGKKCLQHIRLNKNEYPGRYEYNTDYNMPNNEYVDSRCIVDTLYRFRRKYHNYADMRRFMRLCARSPENDPRLYNVIEGFNEQNHKQNYLFIFIIIIIFYFFYKY